MELLDELKPPEVNEKIGGQQTNKQKKCVQGDMSPICVLSPRKTTNRQTNSEYYGD